MTSKLNSRVAAVTLRSDVSDESLIAQYCKTGERGLFETLIQRYEREIFSYLRRYIGNAELAEDAFQGTFLQVHLKCRQFDRRRRFRPWLYAIATNQAIDIQRRNRRHRMASLDRSSASDADNRDGSWSERIVGNAPDPHQVATNREADRWIHQSVGSLGESLQQVVNLVYYQGLKYREAAEVLGIPVGTVKSRLHAAVGRLGVLWEESYEHHSEGSTEKADGN